MSAAKRRTKRKIALLVRMDATHQRMQDDMRGGHARAVRFWHCEMTALGIALASKGLEGAALRALGKARAARGYYS